MRRNERDKQFKYLVNGAKVVLQQCILNGGYEHSDSNTLVI